MIAETVIPEPEVVHAKLKAMGCPYMDLRSIIWLEGYLAGYNKAADETIKRLEGFTL